MNKQRIIERGRENLPQAVNLLNNAIAELMKPAPNLERVRDKVDEAFDFWYVFTDVLDAFLKLSKFEATEVRRATDSQANTKPKSKLAPKTPNRKG